MKIGKLRQVNGFWNNLTFTGNMCRMRSALTNYLSEEGLKSRIEDGLVLFEFDDNHFCASFCMDEGYPECEITYEVEEQETKYLVTHRIIEKNENGYITKGDANNTNDEGTIYENVIRGKLFLIIKVPFK